MRRGSLKKPSKNVLGRGVVGFHSKMEAEMCALAGPHREIPDFPLNPKPKPRSHKFVLEEDVGV